MTRTCLPRLAVALIAAASLLIAAGCGGKPDETAPAACLATPDEYLAALQQAPEPVRLAGGVPISECLVSDQGGGELASIGQSMVVAASRLNNAARQDPGGPAAVQLGYLLGAVSRGADAIHTDLVRRLNSAARFSESGGALPAGFERAFGRGYAAGQRTG